MPATLPFDPSLSEADHDLAALADRVSDSGECAISFCCYGLPGTGKSAYARYIAQRMGLDVIEKRASDLFSMWVGQSEKRIAQAFQEAADRRAMLILDEAHHAAPSSATRYAIDSQFTRAVRRLSSKFEHRLFLSATPHNGHSNSFSSLLEILDPQRFTRGVPVRAGDLDPVMVRRLKSDLKYFGETFPERVVEPIRIAGLPEDSPDLVLPRLLGAYGETLRARAAALPPKQAGLTRLAFVGLQQRLLSSPAAFAHTLAVHLRGLDRVAAASDAAALAFIKGAPEHEHDPEDEQSALALLQEEDDEASALRPCDLHAPEELREAERK